MNKTLQDRLVKELRPRDISGMASGKCVSSGVIEDYNCRFGRVATNSVRRASATAR